MKINRKYPYKDYTRTTDQGRRVYLNGQEKLPSVTTILSRTKEESDGLKKWRERVGEAEAKRIMKEAAQRGSEMHEALEGYLYGQKFQSPTHDAPIALKMANLIISKGLIYLDEIWGVEQTLIYPGSYAGASDLIGLYKQTPTILDFKQANKPKREEWIEDYYLQLAAYICAHEKEYGEIKKGQILVAVKNLTFQEFEISGNRLQDYKDKWWKRVDQFRTSLEQPLPESSPTA